MSKYIKLPSLIIFLLLFFPISFYFNIIPINCNSENNSQILDVNIEIHPDVYSGWYAEILIRTIPNVTKIYSSYLNRDGNIFYLNVSIEFGKNVKNIGINSAWYCYIENNSLELYKCYDLYFIENGKYYFLKEGNYSFILYINDKAYIKNFTINRKEIPPIVVTFPYIFWNGEEWILKVEVYSILIPKKIYCLNPILIKDRKIFEIFIVIEEWGDEIPEQTVVREYNYSLGILPEGEYWVHIYVNGDLNVFIPYTVSRTFTTYIPTTYTTIETYTFKFPTERITTETRISSSKLITTTIKVKESLEKAKSFETTKTTQTYQTFKETKKEYFVEQSTISILLFIIVIITTLLLYYVLFKRGKI